MHRLEEGRENASFGGRKGKCIIWSKVFRETSEIQHFILILEIM